MPTRIDRELAGESALAAALEKLGGYPAVAAARVAALAVGCHAVGRAAPRPDEACPRRATVAAVNGRPSCR